MRTFRDDDEPELIDDVEVTRLQAYLQIETPKAYCINETGQEKVTPNVWLPKSQVKMHSRRKSGKGYGIIVDIEVPEWLAKEKGLI